MKLALFLFALLVLYPLATAHSAEPQTASSAGGGGSQAVPVTQDDAATHTDLSPWLRFSANGFAGLRGEENSFSLELSWNPSYAFSENFGVRLNLGVTALKALPSTVFPVFEYEVLAYLAFDRLELAMGGGGQSWLHSEGTHPLLSTTVAWLIPDGPACIERVFAGYSIYLSSPRATHELKLGLGLQL